MLSGDLEGHAPSWPYAWRQRTRRSASLHKRHSVAGTGCGRV